MPRDRIRNKDVIEYLEREIERWEDGTVRDSLIKERDVRASDRWLDQYLRGDIDG